MCQAGSSIICSVDDREPVLVDLLESSILDKVNKLAHSIEQNGKTLLEPRVCSREQQIMLLKSSTLVKTCALLYEKDVICTGTVYKYRAECTYFEV